MCNPPSNTFQPSGMLAGISTPCPPSSVGSLSCSKWARVSFSDINEQQLREGSESIDRVLEITDKAVGS